MFCKHLKLTLLYISLCCFSKNIAEDVVDCSSEDIVTSIFNAPIDLQLNGTIRLYENVQINALSATTNNEFDKNYIDARLEIDSESDSRNLVIYATAHFAHYAEEQTAARITLKITIACDMGRTRTLIFFQPIKERNYFSPTFSQDIYEIRMPTPIFNGFDLTTFTQISAKDADLTNNQIVFTSVNAERYNIAVGSKNATNADGKVYFADLRLTRIYLSLPNEFSFQIVATDNGIPPLSTNATVVVRADAEKRLPAIPQFQQSFYNATLGMDLALQPLQAALMPETYTSEVNFSKSGEDQQWFSLSHVGNVVSIVLANPLNMSDVLAKQHFQFELRAENSNLVDYGRTAVLVELPNIKQNFRFAKTLYEGYIDESGTNLTIEDITFNLEDYIAEITFQLSGAQQELFTLKQMSNRFNFDLRPEFSMQNWNNTTVFTLELRATIAAINATTVILIRLPKTVIPLPERPYEFQKALYIGTIKDNVELQIEAVVLLTETLEFSKIEFQLSGKYSAAFELISVNNTVELLLKNATDGVMVFKESSIYLVLTASSEQFKTRASIVIETGNNEHLYINKIFDKTWYMGNIEVNATGAQVLNIEEIYLKDGNKVNQFSFTLDGDEVANFTISVDIANNGLQLNLEHFLSAEILEQTHQINLLLSAFQIMDTDVNNTIVIILGLPKRDCTTLAPEYTFVPQFDSAEYIISAQPNQVGSLWQVTAYIQGSNASIRYALIVENEHLQKRVAINAATGDIVLLSYVSPGSYYFRITAENVETLGKSSVNARLDVASVLQCAGEQQFSNVASALIIKYIEEEKAHTNLLNMTVENCTYEISQMYPNDKAYVYINESTNMLSTIKIDREDIVFVNMLQPQIRVSLRLVCVGIAENRTLTRERRAAVDRAISDYYLVLTNDISYSKDVTILSLILVDINDNPPEFLYPIAPTYLGYPEQNICFELFPQHLTQVKAIDRDLGLNAEIRYSMRPNAHFSIDPLSGVIYPKANALGTEEYTELIVLATDREGAAANGLSTGATLFVRRLSAEFYSLLTFIGSERRVLEDYLMDLSNKTEFSITLVKYAVLPGNETAFKTSLKNGKRLRRASGETQILQKAWVYAFQRNKPVNCDDFENKILTLSNAVNVSVESYAAVGLVSNQSISTKPELGAQKEYTVYIVAIITLAILSIICIGLLIWRLYLEKCCFAAQPASEMHCKTRVTSRCADDISFLYPSMIETCNTDSPNISEDNCKITAASAEVDLTDVPDVQVTNEPTLCPNGNDHSHVRFNDAVQRIETQIVEADLCVQRF